RRPRWRTPCGRDTCAAYHQSRFQTARPVPSSQCPSPPPPPSPVLHGMVLADAASGRLDALAVPAPTLAVADAAVAILAGLATHLVLAAQVAVRAVGPQRVARPTARS